MLKKAVIVLWLLILAGCSSSQQIENPVLINLGDITVQEQLTKKLERHDVDYQKIDEISIRVSEDDAQIVVLYANQIQNSIIPFDRSTSLAQPYRSRFIQLLERNGISYEKRQLFNSTWIIWKEQDSSQVERLIEEAVE
jgi:outer membrane murein-binding lipoprotein Lpp